MINRDCLHTTTCAHQGRLGNTMNNLNLDPELDRDEDLFAELGVHQFFEVHTSVDADSAIPLTLDDLGSFDWGEDDAKY